MRAPRAACIMAHVQAVASRSDSAWRSAGKALPRLRARNESHRHAAAHGALSDPVLLSLRRLPERRTGRRSVSRDGLVPPIGSPCIARSKLVRGLQVDKRHPIKYVSVALVQPSASRARRKTDADFSAPPYKGMLAAFFSKPRAVDGTFTSSP